MSIQHVSKTATNGYSVGNDGTADGTKSLPYLTVLAAIIGSSNSDTIKVNDGTYDESFTITGKTGLTIEPENDYLTTFTNPSTTRVVLVDDTATGLTLGKLVLDGEGDTANIIEGDGIADVAELNIVGTEMKDCTSKFIDDGDGSNTIVALNMSGGWSMTGTINQSAIALQATGNDRIYNISDGTITVSQTATSKAAIYSFPTGAQTGISLTVNNVTMNITLVGTLSNAYGVRTAGNANVDVSNCDITFTNVTTSCQGVAVEQHSTATTKAHVYNNTISGDSSGVATLGYGVLIGKDGTGASNNLISDCKVYGNTVSNVDHGILLGYITSGKAYANTIDLTDNALILKGTTTCKSYGNLITRSVTYIQDKQGITDIIANNIIVMSAGYVGRAMLSTLDSAQSNGSKWYNNSVYTDVIILYFVDVDGFLTNEIEFYNNNFYSTVSQINEYSYNGLDYDTSGAFDTAVDAAVGGSSTSTTVDPEFADIVNEDYTIGNSILSVGGSQWWGLAARPVGLDGEPFADRSISVGHIQLKDSTNHPFHPVNL